MCMRCSHHYPCKRRPSPYSVSVPRAAVYVPQRCSWALRINDQSSSQLLGLEVTFSAGCLNDEWIKVRGMNGAHDILLVGSCVCKGRCVQVGCHARHVSIERLQLSACQHRPQAVAQPGAVVAQLLQPLQLAQPDLDIQLIWCMSCAWLLLSLSLLIAASASNTQAA